LVSKIIVETEGVDFERPERDPRSVRSLGIHHVNIGVSDLEQARSFYGDVMGFKEINRPDFPGYPGAWLEIDESHQLHLSAMDGHVPPERQHFAVVVADLDAAISELEDRNVAISRAGSGRQALLRDPCGNLIEIRAPD
jgi:glyoxylase I family protein